MKQDRQEGSTFVWSQWVESAVGFWASAAQCWRELSRLATDRSLVDKSIQNSLSLWRAFQPPWTFSGSPEAKRSPELSCHSQRDGIPETAPAPLSAVEVESVAGVVARKAEPESMAQPKGDGTPEAVPAIEVESVAGVVARKAEPALVEQPKSETLAVKATAAPKALRRKKKPEPETHGPISGKSE